MIKRMMKILTVMCMTIGILLNGTAIRAEETETVSLNWKWFLANDKDPESIKQATGEIAIGNIEDNSETGQWMFSDAIPTGEEKKATVLISKPDGNEAKPSGFKVKEGTGTESDPYTFELVYPEEEATYTVTLTGGANASADPAANKPLSVEQGNEMEPVKYTANAGFHFIAYEEVTVNGVTASLIDGVITVSGTPTDNVEIVIPDAVQDEKKPESASSPDDANKVNADTAPKANIQKHALLNTTNNVSGSGTPENPWEIGADDSPESVKAYLTGENNNKTLHIEGNGEMMGFDPGSNDAWHKDSIYSQITAVTISQGVDNIGYYSFHGCANLTSVTIPSTVTYIGNSAFENCNNLETVTIPRSVTRILSWAFQNCSKLETVLFESGSADNSIIIFNDAFSGSNAKVVYGEGTTRLFDNNTQITTGALLTDIIGSNIKELIWRTVTLYPLWVGGERVTSGNASDVFSDGKVSYIPAAGETPATLKLNDYSYEGAGYQNAVIYAEESLTIELTGNNTVTHSGDASSYGIFVNQNGANLSITGEGALNATAGEATGSENGNNSAGIYVQDGDIDVTGTCTVTATGGKSQMESYGIGQFNNTTAQLNVDSGTKVIATAGDAVHESDGIKTYTLTVDGKVTATGGKTTSENLYSCGINSLNGVTVRNKGKLEAIGNTDSTKSTGIHSLLGQTALLNVNENVQVTLRGNTCAFSTISGAYQYTAPEGMLVMEANSFDGSGATVVTADSQTKTTSKYVHVAKGGSHYHDGTTFLPWLSNNSLPQEGSYYLTQDVIVNSCTSISSNLDLCLNGYGILMRGNDSVFLVESGKYMNLYDCNGSEEPHYIKLENWRGTEVSVTDSATDVIDGNGVVQVTGGYITGGNATETGGGAFRVYGNFHMFGGTLLGNYTGTSDNKGSGGAIWSSGAISINDNSRIMYNKGTDGDRGGVYISGGTFIISGAPDLRGNSGRDVVLNGKDKRIQINRFDPKVRIGVIYCTGNPEEWVITAHAQFTSDKEVREVFTAPSTDRTIIVSNGQAKLVTVTPVQNVTLMPTTETITEGKTKVLTANVTPSNAWDKTVKWSVNNSNVALYADEACTEAVGTGATDALTVYAKGLSVGSAKVTVTSNADSTKKAECDVTVAPRIAVTGVALNKTTATLAINSRDVLTATVTPEDATDKTVTWTTSNPNVATVDKDGVIWGVASGEAIITATATNGTPGDTSDDKIATCTVTVNADAIPYPLWVGGTQATSVNLGSEGWSYTPAITGDNPTPAVLRLNNYRYSGIGYNESAIFTKEDLTIELSGESTVTRETKTGTTISYGISGSNAIKLTVTGNGILNARGEELDKGSSYGIYLPGNGAKITVESDATVKASGGKAGGNSNSRGVYSGGSIIVKGTLEGTAASNTDCYGIQCKAMTVEGGTVISTGTTGIEITDNNSGLTISETGTVTASGTSRAIHGNVDNKTAGTGWTDTDGTQGETPIAINTKEGGQELDYRKVMFPDAAPKSVSFLDWDAEEKTFVPGTCSNYSLVNNSEADVSWGEANKDKWYVVNKDVTINGQVNVNGNVHLILCNGAKLTVSNTNQSELAAINVSGTASLTVYAQTTDETMGQLKASGSHDSLNGINANGSITINGGNIVSNGGTAGVFVNQKETSRLYIRGGTLTAVGEYGIQSFSGGVLDISGGTVNAKGTIDGVFSGGNTTISGNGSLIATGTADNSIGIDTGNAGAISINSGSLIASGNARAIGGNGKVKNQIPGTGWIDTEGTTGKTDISTGEHSASELSSHLKVQFPAVPDPVASVTTSSGTTLYPDFGNAVTAWNEAGDGAVLTLLADVTTTKTVDVNGGSSDQPKVLNLNGFGILAQGFVGASVINVSENAHLELKDDAASKPDHYIQIENDHGIQVSDHSEEYGKWVKVTGGYITGGNGGGNGGGVYVKGNFCMLGGNIIGNVASYGGGVLVGSSGNCSITGGTITNNLVLTGGSGGGVYNSGTLNISGNPVIKDNKRYNADCNVQLGQGKRITFTGALVDPARIGVTMESPGVFTNSTGSTKASDYGNRFFSDNANYSVLKDENELILGTHQHSFLYTSGGGIITATCIDETCPLHNNPTTLIIGAPLHETYGDGLDAAATLTNLEAFNATTGMSVAVKDIRYVGRDGTSYTESEIAPANAGKYTAKITLNGVKTDEGEGKSVTASVKYTIAPKEVTVSGITAENKTYDQTTKATLNTADAVIRGKLNDDVLSVTAEGVFENENAGVDKTVTIRDLILDGKDKDNYVLAAEGQQLTVKATISKATLTELSLTKYIVKKDSGEADVDVASVTAGKLSVPAGAYTKDIPSHSEEGSYTVTVTAVTSKENSNYTGTVTATFHVVSGGSKAFISEINDETVYSYTGSAITPSVSVRDINDHELNPGVHYNVRYSDNVYAGYGKVTITGIDDYRSSGPQIHIFEITKAAPTFTEPTAITGLKCIGESQELINAGATEHGTLKYAVTGDSTAPAEDAYSAVIPSGTDAGTYYVWYKVFGDNNHNDSEPASVSVTIDRGDISPSVSLNGWTYGEAAETPTVTGNSGNGEVTYTYKVKGADDSTYSNVVPKNAGDYTVKAVIAETTNYKGNTATSNFTIAPKAVTISGITASDKTYDGNTTATLDTSSASISGKLDDDKLTVSATGAFDNANVGEGKTVTINGLALGGDSIGNYVLASVGHQTTATAKITAKEVGLTWSNTELTYNGEPQKPTAAAAGLITGDTCTVTVTGEQTNVGENYTATAASLSNSNYMLPANKTVTFKIIKANPTVKAPSAKTLIYTGSEQPLVNAGTATGGTMQYAVGTDATTAPTDNWSASIPTGTALGTYYVWYKVVGDENHTDTAPEVVTATISNAYKVIGDNQEWTKGSTANLTITIKGEPDDTNTYDKWIEKGQRVVIDGEIIAADNYKASKGSLVIDLKSAYLEGLKTGKHTMNVTFTDGSASAVFNIKDKSSGGGSSTPEKKTDNVVTCQMAGYPANYAWNEAAKACQPGYIDANGVFRSTAKANSVPRTYDKGVGGNAASLLIAMIIATAVSYILRKY